MNSLMTERTSAVETGEASVWKKRRSRCLDMIEEARSSFANKVETAGELALNILQMRNANRA